MIKDAKNVSIILRGSAKNNILKGSTFIFSNTSHINIKPKNQAIKVVCINENFSAIM